MRDFSRTVMALAAFAYSTCGVAEITELSPGTFVCEARRGHFDQADVSRYVNGDTISGSIRAISEDSGTRYASSAALRFELSDGLSIGADVVADNRHPGFVFVVIRGGKNMRDQSTFVSAPREIAVPVSATYSERGILTVRSGRFSRSVRVRRRGPVEPRIHCQGGRFQITVMAEDPAPPRAQ